MAVAKPTDVLSSGFVDDPPAKPKKKKPKLKPVADQGGKYAVQTAKPNGGVISVKTDTGDPSNAKAPPLVRVKTGSVRQLAVPPEGGYATGFYRVLLERLSVETLCRSLSLQYRHVAQLHRLFGSEDDYSTGEITIDEFFHAIGDEKRPLTLGIFRYVGLAPTIARLTFDDFVLCVVTFAALSRKELLHYAFSLFDKDESGMMDMAELREFYGGLKNKNAFFFQKNVDIAQKKLAEKDHTSPGTHHHADADGLVDFEDLQEGTAHFQLAFFPLQQFQRNLQVAALGEAFWSNVVLKKSQMEQVVHYMRLHEGHLPPLSMGTRISAMARYAVFVLTGGGATTVVHGGPIALRHAAVTKYAEEMRQRTLEEEARKQANEEEKRLWLAERDAERDAEDLAAHVAGSMAETVTPVVPYSLPSEVKASDDEGATLLGLPSVITMKAEADAPHKKKTKKKTPKKTTVAVE